MAEDWLKWTYGLAGKREVRIMASRCHRDRHEIAGRVMTLWEWLETNLSEADIDPDTGDASIEMGDKWKQEIDEIAGLPNLAEVLASADVSWVIPARSGGRVTFPRLGRHVGKLAKTRAMEARKKSRQRRDKCPDDNGTTSGPEERREDSKNSAPPAREEPAVPDELLTRLQALAQASNAGVPEDFASFIFDDWHPRGGKDGAGVKTPWAGYVKKRWNREQQEWIAGTHRGKQKKGGANGKAQRRTEADRDRDRTGGVSTAGDGLRTL